MCIKGLRRCSTVKHCLLKATATCFIDKCKHFTLRPLCQPNAQRARRYSAASWCSLSSGTDMKIFWQNMVKISEEKQLTRLATRALRRQVTACQTLAFHWLAQTSSHHHESGLWFRLCEHHPAVVIPEQTVINATPALPEQIQKVGLRKHKGLTHPASSWPHGVSSTCSQGGRQGCLWE